MRVLLTTDTVGGVWTFTRELTPELLNRGHAVALVSFGRPPSTRQSAWCESMLAEYGEAFLFRCSTAPLEWMQNNDAAYAEGAELLLKIGREFAADFLHANQFCWGGLPADLPRLITAHSDVLSWAAACHPEGLPPSGWLSRYKELVQRGLDGADIVVTPSAWMQDAISAHFRISCPSVVIHNGRTAMDSLRAGTRKLQAVSAGRLWDEGKGLELLLEMDAPLPILIAGEASFQGASAKTGSLQITGHLEEDGLFELFRSSSIYIATSIYEPFGLAPLEAALCGCAIVARKIPSLREVWGDSALFFEDAVELSSILAELVNEPSRLRRAQEMAERHARQFTAARMAEGYLAAYEALLYGGQAASSCVQEPVTHAA